MYAENKMFGKYEYSKLLLTFAVSIECFVIINIFTNLKMKKKMEKNLVFRNESGVAVTTSALVATIFEKEQFTVVRDIDNLVEKLHSIENQCPTKLEEHQQMFEAYYEDVIQPNGGVKSAKRYFMNKDGFTTHLR